MKDFFAFRLLITLPTIKVIYPIGTLVIAWSSLSGAFNDVSSLLFGLFNLLVGNLIWRLWCEFWVALFDTCKGSSGFGQVTRTDKPVLTHPEEVTTNPSVPLE